MFKKIQDVQAERDSVVAQVIKVEDENLDLKRAKDRLMIENTEVLEQKAEVEDDLSRTKNVLDDTSKNLQETAMMKKDVEMTLENTGLFWGFSFSLIFILFSLFFYFDISRHTHLRMNRETKDYNHWLHFTHLQFKQFIKQTHTKENGSRTLLRRRTHRHRPILQNHL